jgi:hypothetical protein
MTSAARCITNSKTGFLKLVSDPNALLKFCSAAWFTGLGIFDSNTLCNESAVLNCVKSKIPEIYQLFSETEYTLQQNSKARLKVQNQLLLIPAHWSATEFHTPILVFLFGDYSSPQRLKGAGLLLLNGSTNDHASCVRNYQQPRTVAHHHCALYLAAINHSPSRGLRARLGSSISALALQQCGFQPC